MSFITPFINGDTKPEKRSGHVSFTYQGQFFVFAGYGDLENQEDEFLPTRHTWCYNVEASQWTRCNTKGEPPGRSTGACATVIGHKVYLFGGYYQNEGQTNKLFCLDLKTLTWSDITDGTIGLKPSPRDKFGSWKYLNKIVYFGGFGHPPENINKVKGDFCFEEFPRGLSRGFGWNNHLFVFNTEKLKWSQPACSGSTPYPRAAFAYCQIGLKGYLFGGRFKDERRNDLYCLDLKTFEWSEVKLANELVMPVGRSWHVMAKASDNHLFIYGGFDTNGEALKDAWLINLQTKSWFELENASRHLGYFAPRLWHTISCSDSPGEILVFGGCATSVLGTENTAHTNLLSVFRFSPLSLQRQCLDFVMLNIGRYHTHFELLPKSLQRNISHRSHALGLNVNNGHGKLINNCQVM